MKIAYKILLKVIFSLRIIQSIYGEIEVRSPFLAFQDLRLSP